MTTDQKRAALFEQYHRLKERVDAALQRYRQGHETFETASLAVLSFGQFTLMATEELHRLSEGAACERN